MRARGITVVELLTTLALAGVLLALAAPAFTELVARERGRAAMNQLIGAVNLARAEAVLKRRVVTLCPAAGATCLGRNQWHRGALIFVDHDADGRRDPAETVLRRLPGLGAGARLYWRSFRNRSFLQFHPRGYTRWQNGNFLYCPADGDVRHARMTILNAQGRLRTARDGDGDGVQEDARGRALTCP